MFGTRQSLSLESIRLRLYSLCSVVCVAASLGLAIQEENLEQESLPKKPDPDPQAQTVSTKTHLYLDRGDFRNKGEPEPGKLPEKYYKVEDKPPYQILLPDQKESQQAKVAILDTTSELVLNESEQLKIVSSHFEAVKRAIRKDTPILGFDVGVMDNPYGASSDKINQVLEYLKEKHEELNVGVINASFGRRISLETVADLIENYAENPPKDLEITSENIHEYSKFFRSVLENLPSNHPNFSEFLAILVRADLIQDLSNQGLVFVQSAGNKPNTVSCTSLLVPDAIIVCGKEPGLMFKPGSKFSDSSLVDIYENPIIQQWVHGNIIAGGVIEIDGTSFAAPRVIDEVLKLLDRGLSVKSINYLFRLRTQKAKEQRAQTIANLYDHSARKEALDQDTDFQTAYEEAQITLEKRATKIEGREVILTDMASEISREVKDFQLTEDDLGSKSSVSLLMEKVLDYTEFSSMPLLLHSNDTLNHLKSLENTNLQDFIQVLNALDYAVVNPIATQVGLNQFLDHFNQLNNTERTTLLEKLNSKQYAYEQLNALNDELMPGDKQEN